jgi:RecA/RadA recombinase
MAAKKKNTEEKEDKKTLGTKEFTEQFFKSNKETIFNLEDEADEYLISTGSLILDAKIGGGLGSGVHRFVGVTEGGKTSAALEVMRNFIKQAPNSKGLYVKAEGRLSKKVQVRSGLEFTKSAADWEVGTCLIFETNIYDTTFDFLRGLLKNNPNNEKFCIIIDSMDGLMAFGDLSKSTGDAAKVAAGAVMTSDFLKRVSLGMSKFGHLCIMTSQQRSKVSIDPYAKQDNNNTTQSSGGNAAMHYPDWIFEFQRAFKADKILDKPDAPLGPDNKQYGHMAKVLICKSTNETTGEIVRYPIKYGRTDGTSVWIEREVADLLLMWGFFEKGGAGWFTVDNELIEYVKNSGKEFPEKIQGMKNIYGLLENDSQLFTVLKDFALTNCADK